MTLILSCLTADYAIQVSDRRLTLPDGSLYDDHSNKAILVNGNIIFGYTGLAFFDNRKTRNDEWFLNALSEAHKAHPNVSLTTTAEFIANRATEEVSRMNITPKLKRLAFVGVGWGKPPEQEGLKPIYLIISNSHNSDGRWSSQAQPKFSVLVFTPPDDLPVMLVSDGQLLNSTLRKRVLRLLNKCVEKGLSPKTIAQILVATARNVASSNPAVGRNLLVNSIPKNSVRPGLLNLIGHLPMSHRQTFTYVPENTSLQVQYGPYVFHHGVLIKEIKSYRT